jgi:amino acid adenylation domain-containing protein
MNDVIKLILELAAMDIRIYLEKGVLKIDAPDGVVLDAVLPKIRLHKAELIGYLSDRERVLIDEIPSAPEQEHYVLSSAQKRLWILSQFEESNLAYNMPGLYLLEGKLDRAALANAFDLLIERHESLRTVFGEVEGEVRQHIAKEGTYGFILVHHDVRQLNETQVQELVQQALAQPFDLSAGPLLRAELYEVDTDKYLLAFAVHHIVADGWSMDILMKELVQLYHANATAQPHGLPALGLQYKDYAAWEQEQLKGRSLIDHKAYWLRQLEGELPVLALPLDKPRPAVRTYNGSAMETVISKETAQGLRLLAQQQDSSLFMGLMAVVNVLLYKYSGQEDLVIGSPIAGREHHNLGGQIGFYVNTLALRSRFKANDTFKDLLQQVRQLTLDAYEHQLYPFDALVEDLGIRHDASRHPLFDVMVQVQNAQVRQQEQGSLKISRHEVPGNLTSKFDLLFDFIDEGEGLRLRLEYNTDLYEGSTINKLAGHLVQVLSAVVAQPSIALAQLDYLSASEKAQLLVIAGNTNVSYPVDATITSLFEAQAERTPNNTAVVFENACLTYTELNEQANRLAHYLRERYSIKPDDLVGIKLERGLEMIVAILAILKSGAAYVPVDPQYPQERIDYMIADSNCKTIIDESELQNFYSNETQYNSANPSHINKPSDLAYVIYTSGTTGKPKGSLIEHRNVVRLLVNDQQLFDFNASDVWTMFHSYCFDFSVWEMYGALLFGGKLVVVPSLTAKDPNAFRSLLQSEGVTVLNQTPSAFHQLIKEELEQDNATLQLRYVIFGGEALSPGKLSAWHGKYPATALINMYGITETTVHVTYKEITGKEISTNSASIGKPIPTLRCYVLDQQQQLLPIGVDGELYVGGDGVCRGYLNRPELTAKKFIENPFKAGEKLYRSGDKAKMLANGELEYGGRIDDQVKIRGYRIELGEIENAFRRNSKIEDVVLIAKADAKGEMNLIAYLVSPGQLNITELRLELAAQLPSYMLPSHYVQLDKLPLTSNGKINKKSLPEPEGSGLQTGVEYVAPRTNTEKVLVGIWQELLDRENISVKDNFFEIGGHSLKAARLASQLYKAFEVKLVLKELFTYAILEDQAKLVDRAQRTVYADIMPVALAADYVLSSSQWRLWVASQLEEGNIAHNIPGAYVFEGHLDRDALANAFGLLIARHESLRTVFRQDEQGRVRQFIQLPHDTGFAIDQQDLRISTALEIKQKVQADFIAPFDLANGPLLRASLYRVADDRWVFSYVMHHIISDGWSMGILIKELLQYYKGVAQPGPLHLQYKDYAAWQQLQLAGETPHKAYWLKQFEGELPVLELSIDQPRPLARTYAGEVVSGMIGQELTQKIKTLSQQEGGTLFMALVAAVNALLYRYTGQPDIVIGSQIAGRDHPGLEDQIGFYLNTLALRMQFERGNTYRELMGLVRRSTLDAYSHAAYPFDELIDALQLKHDPSRNPLFDVTVVLQNTEHAVVDEETGGLKIRPYSEGELQTSRFDLSFDFNETQEGIEARIVYSTDLYTKASAQRMLAHFHQLLRVLAEQPATPIQQLDYLSATEKEQLLVSFNDTSVQYPAHQTIVSLFEAQVERTPNNTAVAFENASLTYKELNEQANRLAHYLRERYSIKPDDLVGIKLDRGLEMIVSILAILKSGAAYVPVDPQYPQERIDYMIADSNCKALIDESELQKFYSNGTQYSSVNPSHINKPSDLAYVIYTSGTTGKPKGSLIEHRNVVRLLVNDRPLFDFNDSDVWTMFHSYCFDFSVWEMYGALLFGGKLVVVPSLTAKDPNAFRSLLQSEGVTVLNQTPSAFHQLIKEELEQDNATLQLRYVIFGGEALSPGKLSAWHGKYPATALINMYGITETTVHVTYKEITGKEISTNSASIGKPIPTLRCYVLDQQQQLLPIGVDGELYVGGDGVCRGYLNRPELTAKKFIENPFKAGEKLYRSGDKAKMLANGELEYGGRIDDQVKIRGYRIELGEIENAFRRNSKIEDVVLIAKADAKGEMNLIAYLVSPEQLNITELRLQLAAQLPSYMLPAFYVQLDKLPLTSNGKIDKKNLPEPDGSVDTAVQYVAPRTNTEKVLVGIWQELLDRENISVKDNFFEIGGHSLKATRLSGQIHKAFEVRVELKDIFSKGTLEEQAQLIDAARKTEFISIRTVDEQASYALSPAQRRLWVLSQFEESNIAYNTPGAYVFEGELDGEVLASSFRTLIARHEILRTVFKEDEQGQVRQFILSPEQAAFSIASHDLRGKANRQEVLEQLVRAEFDHSFNLTTGPLLRAALCRLEDDRWVFTYVMHHIISDGWSMEVLLKELLYLYGTGVNGQADGLKPLRIQYKDYAAWQQEQLEGPSLLSHKTYWLDQFEGELPLLELPADKPRPAVKTYNGATITKIFNARLVNGVRELGKEQGGTLFMGMLAGINALLYRYTGQEDIITGTQIAGRDHTDLEDQIGMYLNTLALRARFSGADNYRELLANIKQLTLDAYEHQVYPFDDLIEALDLQRDLSRNPLFNVSVVLHNKVANAAKEQHAKLKISSYDRVENLTSKFDMAFDLAEAGDEVLVSLVYNSDLYAQSTAQQLLAHLERFMEAIIAQPSVPIRQLDYLSEEEKNKLLVSFNDTTVAYPSDRSIAELFEEQATKTPGNIALVFENKQLTYRELNEQSNRLANYLRAEHSIKADDRIALMVDRSEWLMIAILAIFKSGAAYVPVDAAYPKTRKSFILEDTSAKLLITQSDHIFDLDYYTGSVFAIDVQLDGLETSSSTPESINKSTDLAYVMYTSGSTGTPKGVLVEHRSVVRLVKASNYVSFTGEEVILSTGAVSFDATTFEYWGTLLNGGKLVLCSTETLLDEQKLSQKILAEGVDMMWFTSGWLNQLVEKDLSVFAALKTILTGGDRISPAHVQLLRAAYPGLRIINCYGPTENTTFSLTHDITDTVNVIPIGRPISNSTVYILDTAAQLCPVGVCGEICVGGDGLSRGYLNREELTQQKFVTHPFEQGQKIYKTGDMGRWLPDGNIEFLGRKDDQVKIRGFRIELGEVERTLQTHEAVDAVVVIATTDGSGEKQLIAYITGNAELSAAELRTHIGKTLPSYMVPDHFVQLEALPLTAHGKVDKRALPAAEGLGLESGTEYIAPITETEQKLAGIWSEILGKEKVSVKDNFFEIGGHSLKATRLGSQIHKLFDVRLELKDLFSKVTIEEQAQLIEDAKKTTFVSIQPLGEQADYALSSSQRRLWVLSQFEEGSVAYNMPSVYVFEGQLDHAALESAFQSLIARHEALRTIFKEDEHGEIRQVILPAATAFHIAEHDLRDEAHATHVLKTCLQHEFARPFNLATGPLLRANLYQLAEDKWVFTYVLHHIVSDGWSMGILMKELVYFYNEYNNGNEQPKTALPIQYKDYAAWQQQQLSGESLSDHKNYWLKQFSGELPVLELHSDHARPAVKTYNGGIVSKTIDVQLAQAIKAIGQEQGSTLYMTLLAAVKTLLYKYTGQQDLVIGSPIAGRQHADLEEQIGFYLNTLALRTQFSGQDSYEQLVKNVQQVTLGAYEHQVYPFDQLVDELDLQRDTSRHPLFDIMVILQNAGSQDAELQSPPGLSIKPYEAHAHIISKFDLLFDFSEVTGALELNLEYNSDVYNRSTAERMTEHFVQLLQAIAKNPSLPVEQLDYLTDAEKQQLLSGFNDTQKSFTSENKTLVELFEEQAQQRPHEIALVFDNRQFTYTELNECANRLAHYLRQHYAVKADDLVAVQLDRSEWMIVSLLAVLKSGGAYMPINPQFPQERIGYMIADSNCKAVIDTAELERFFAEQDKQSSTNPDRINTCNDLAYVLYTSGSTGRPKGCMLEHRGVVNRLEWMWVHYGFGSEDVILQKTTFTFDVSVWELFLPLCWGAKMVLCEDEDIAVPERIATLIETHQVTCLHFVPGMLNAFIASLFGSDNIQDRLQSLRLVITSGEALAPATVHAWYEHLATPLHNLYGPTEASVDVTYYATSPGDTVIPIGRPIWNTQMYITGKNGEPSGIGVAGELHIAGVGLARGYLNRPELTAEKFVTNPFNAGQKMYKTGDLGRWLPDGNIEFLGRKDDQVKVRGYRIELGEIESALLSHADVKAAVVIARADAQGDRELVAYVITDLATAELRAHLGRTLPPYMLPAYYISLENMPLTATGKIDKKALPDVTGMQAGTEYMAPRTETEERLVAIWEELLDRERIGVRDNFFDLGGHSLKATRLITRIRKEFNVEIDLKNIFHEPTIEVLSDNIINHTWFQEPAEEEESYEEIRL